MTISDKPLGLLQAKEYNIKTLAFAVLWIYGAYLFYANSMSGGAVYWQDILPFVVIAVFLLARWRFVTLDINSRTGKAILMRTGILGQSKLHIARDEIEKVYLERKDLFINLRVNRLSLITRSKERLTLWQWYSSLYPVLIPGLSGAQRAGERIARALEVPFADDFR